MSRAPHKSGLPPHPETFPPLKRGMLPGEAFEVYPGAHLYDLGYSGADGRAIKEPRGPWGQGRVPRHEGLYSPASVALRVSVHSAYGERYDAAFDSDAGFRLARVLKDGEPETVANELLRQEELLSLRPTLPTKDEETAGAGRMFEWRVTPQSDELEDLIGTPPEESHSLRISAGLARHLGQALIEAADATRLREATADAPDWVRATPEEQATLPWVDEVETQQAQQLRVHQLCTGGAAGLALPAGVRAHPIKDDHLLLMHSAFGLLLGYAGKAMHARGSQYEGRSWTLMGVAAAPDPRRQDPWTRAQLALLGLSPDPGLSLPECLARISAHQAWRWDKRIGTDEDVRAIEHYARDHAEALGLCEDALIINGQWRWTPRI